MCFVGVTTVTAGVLSIQNIFWPLVRNRDRCSRAIWIPLLMAIFIVGVVLVVFDAVRRWIAVLNGAEAARRSIRPAGLGKNEIKMGCC